MGGGGACHRDPSELPLPEEEGSQVSWNPVVGVSLAKFSPIFHPQKGGLSPSSLWGQRATWKGNCGLRWMLLPASRGAATLEGRPLSWEGLPGWFQEVARGFHHQLPHGAWGKPKISWAVCFQQGFPVSWLTCFQHGGDLVCARFAPSLVGSWGEDWVPRLCASVFGLPLMHLPPPPPPCSLTLLGPCGKLAPP